MIDPVKFQEPPYNCDQNLLQELDEILMERIVATQPKAQDAQPSDSAQKDSAAELFENLDGIQEPTPENLE